DQPIHRGDQDFEMINKWLDMSDLRKTASEFSFPREDKIYRVIVNVLYGYRKSRIKCYQLSIDDVTDERRYIRLLQEGRRSAENVSQAKGDFLARMSH
ncbi:MAG: hypothetical protein J6X60_05220, partial [Ruminiclostridium sp.]|nr:hypothetical protein [Ruminiclostridium sp.]